MNITDSGYLHEQDNQKIIRNNGTDKLLVEEKGLNTYKRIDEKECAAAKITGKKIKSIGERFGKYGRIISATHNSISLKNKIDDKFLHEYLIDLGKRFCGKKNNRCRN